MQWISPILAVAGLLSVVVSAVMVGRNKSKDETIDAQQSTIEAKQSTIDSFISGQAELRTQMEERERRCEREIAELRGKVNAIAEQQSDVIAGLLAPRIVDGLVEAARDGRWRTP